MNFVLYNSVVPLNFKIDNLEYDFPTTNNISTNISKTSEITPVKNNWWDNITTSTPLSNLQHSSFLYKNGDVAEIKSKKSKNGHTAVFYNGLWYSDFKLKKMNPYNDPDAKIRIFRNPNLLEAEQGAINIASRAGNKSTGWCARKVREGFDLVSGNYKGEGYNGGLFGDYLSKKGWMLIALKGMKFKWAEYNPYLNSDSEVPDFNLDNLLYPDISSSVQQPLSVTQLSKVPWYHSMLTNTPAPEIGPSTTVNLKLYTSAFKGNQSEFAKMAYNTYKNLGLSHNQALILAGQDALESKWGKSQSGVHNYGGIKSKDGTRRTTKEIINGKETTIEDTFKNYNSYEEYAKDKYNLLNGNKYHAFDSDDIKLIASNIKKGGYATDDNYVKKLLEMSVSINKRL